MSHPLPEIELIAPCQNTHRCCVCGHLLPYHPVFCDDHECPQCGSTIWCFQRRNGSEPILEVLPGRTPTTEELDRLVRALSQQGPAIRVTIDLSSLDIISSGLVAMLVLLNKRIRVLGGSLRLCDLSPVVWDIFRRFKLDTLFEITERATD